MVNDPIADFLIRIKNGYLAGKKEIKAPYSKIKEGVGKILLKEGYIKNFKVQTRLPAKQGSRSKMKTKSKTIVVNLLYQGKKPALEDVKRISKPGVRIYTDCKHLPWVLSGYGTAIISTSKGLMTAREAKKRKLGGEVICKIW